MPKVASQNNAKRLHVTLPDPLYNELVKFVEQRNSSVVDELRAALKVWLIVLKNLETDPDVTLIIQGRDEEKTIRLPVKMLA